LRLLCIFYFVGNARKDAAVIEIGRNDGKLHGLVSNLVTDEEKNIVLNAAPLIDKMPLYDTPEEIGSIHWLKDKLPALFREREINGVKGCAYHTYSLEKINVDPLGGIHEIGKK
jgi:hypothetical protein